MMRTCRPALALLGFLLICLLASPAWAAGEADAIRSARSGAWSAPDTWHGGKVPAAGARVLIRPGDRVFFEPGENHWHGAASNRFMTHIAIQEADDSGSPVTWGEHVTDEEYAASQPGES